MGSNVTLCSVKFSSYSGRIDESENLWVFSQDVSLISVSDIEPALNDFYTVHLTNWSPELSGTVPGTIELYDITAHLAGTPHGPPYDMGPLSGLLSTSGDPLPGEVAVCVDYHADLTGIPEFGTGTRPRARRRGRHYHGPMRVTSLTHDSATNEPSWGVAGAGTTGQFQTAYSDLLGALPTGVEWDVWSRKDAAIYPVIGGWVDEAPRSQRRRTEDRVKAFWS